MVDQESNFKHMKFIYDDYQLVDDRIKVLKDLRNQFIDSLKQDVLKFIDDPLCTIEAIHVTGTIGQANCLFWFEKRCFRITASVVKVSLNLYLLTYRVDFTSLLLFASLIVKSIICYVYLGSESS